MKCCEGHAVDLIGRMPFVSRVELAGLLGADDRETERVLGALREAGLDRGCALDCGVRSVGAAILPDGCRRGGVVRDSSVP